MGYLFSCLDHTFVTKYTGGDNWEASLVSMTSTSYHKHALSNKIECRITVHVLLPTCAINTWQGDFDS